MARKAAPRESLTILDFSDREFLLIVVDCYDADGWALSTTIQQRMNLAYRRTASSRLSWLARYGAVEREYERDEHGQLRLGRTGKPRPTQRWRLTAIGEQLAFGKLLKSDETALGKLSDDKLLLVTRWLQDRTHANGRSFTLSKLVDREWRHGRGR